MASRSRAAFAILIYAILVAGCGVNSSSSVGKADRRGAERIGHVRAAQAVVSRKPSLEVQRLDTRKRVVESLISAADLAGRNDWRRFDRAIADARRAIHRYRQSTAGDTAVLSDVESLALAVDHVIALANYDGTVPDIDFEIDDEADAADINVGAGVDIGNITSGVSDAIAAAAKPVLVEHPQR